MRKEGKKTTRRLTVSAILAALGVVLLMLGSLVQVLDLSMAAIASLTVVFAVIEIRGKYPLLIYVVTSLLSLLLLPVKTAALIYFLFAGYYPMVKEILEKKLPKGVAFAVKILLFCVGGALALLAAEKLFLMDLSLLWANWWYLLLLVPIFLLYDIALTRLISAYVYRWRARLRFPEL